jgi:prepilin-type N-terminal cleavage/methylation domain-containing protein
VSNLLKKEKGFTLIEIVLVLAIAGLILVIVFLAVSGAQKSRRDTQRKSDNARLLSQVESYASNNSGSYAGLTAAAFASYLPSNFNDPLSGAGYTIAYPTSFTTGPPTPLTCTQGTDTIYVNGRQVDTVMGLEQGCQDLKNY